MQKLDIEDEDERLARIQSSLEKLNASSASATSLSSQFQFHEPSKPHFISPPTELLSRIQAFLPALEASNTLLAQRIQADPKSVDIEHVEDGMEQYIEMNLGLGVFEQRTAGSPNAKTADVDAEMTSSESESSSSSESDAQDSDTDDSDDAEIITSFTPVRPIKPLPKRKWVGPRIVLLGQSGESEAVG